MDGGGQRNSKFFFPYLYWLKLAKCGLVSVRLKLSFIRLQLLINAIIIYTGKATLICLFHSFILLYHFFGIEEICTLRFCLEKSAIIVKLIIKSKISHNNNNNGKKKIKSNQIKTVAVSFIGKTCARNELT